MERLLTFLLGARIDPPDGLPSGAIPMDVTLRCGTLIPRLGGLLTRMTGPAAAVTLRRTIVLRPDVRLSSDLLAHELVHVRQWRDDPLFFPVRYCIATLRHGNHDNPYEVEARGPSTSISPNVENRDD